MQESGEVVTTHRDTFRGEALSSATALSESARRQLQRITCIPQGNAISRSHAYFCCMLHACHSWTVQEYKLLILNFVDSENKQ